MAQITWRNVDAPQLSIRDIALAGGQVTAGFDRFAQALATREANLRTKATDAAIGARLAIQDPNQLGQIDPASLDPRVNMRMLLEADNQHRNGLIQRAQQQEQLLDAQASAKFAAEGVPLLRAAQAGDMGAIDALNARAGADPEFARWYGRMSGEVASALDTGADNRRADLQLDQQRETDNARIGLERSHLALAQREATRNEEDRAAMTTGIEFAENWMSQDRTAASTQDAVANLIKREDFLKLPEPAQRAALARITDTNRGRDALMQLTADDLHAELQPGLTTTANGRSTTIPRITLGDALGQLTQLEQEAQAAAVVERNRFLDEQPVLRTFDRLAQIREAAEKNPEAAPTADSIYALAGDRGISRRQVESVQQQYNLGYDELAAILADGSVRDATYWEAQLGMKGGFWEGGEDALRASAKALHDAKTNKGYTENLQAELDKRTREIARTQQQARDLSAQLGRAVRSGAPSTALLDRMDALLQRRALWNTPPRAPEERQR